MTDTIDINRWWGSRYPQFDKRAEDEFLGAGFSDPRSSPSYL